MIVDSRLATTRRTAFGVAGVALIGVGLLANGPNVDLPLSVSTLLVLLWWWGPSLLNLVKARTDGGGALIGVALAVAAPALLWAVIYTEGSTAAIGLATVPMLLWGATGLALMIDITIARRRQGDRT